MTIDLNCDLGEGAGHDADLLALATTANVCCGAHAGDEATSLATLRLAVAAGVRVGAHPGYADRENFGRHELALNEEAIYDLCASQVESLSALAEQVSAKLNHIKPHGALYNQACRDVVVARPIVAVAQHFQLPLLGLPASMLEIACAGRVDFIREGFADRGYRADGSLVPRTEPGAFVTDPGIAADQAERLLKERGVRTLCVHGDGPHALDFLRALRFELIARGFTIRPFA